jgi:hypothetical protein
LRDSKVISSLSKLHDEEEDKDRSRRTHVLEQLELALCLAYAYKSSIVNWMRG